MLVLQHNPCRFTISVHVTRRSQFFFAVSDSSSASRAQRASARNMNSAPSASDSLVPDGVAAALSMQSVPDSDLLAMAVDSDAPSISRSNSGINLDDSMSGTSNGKTKGTRKDKGKGKEVDKALIRVKEEEVVPSLSPDPVAGPVSSSSALLVFRYLTFLHKLNEDHCSACAYMGSLVYCDGCPRAYHLWCLDPPMEATDVPEGDKWFCPSCAIRKVRIPGHCNVRVQLTNSSTIHRTRRPNHRRHSCRLY